VSAPRRERTRAAEQPRTPDKNGAPAGQNLLEAFDSDRLCERCAASICAPNDTLCPSCRGEIDEAFADAPGAGR
jgi:hypothetical protein